MNDISDLMLKSLFFLLLFSMTLTLNAQTRVLAFAGSSRADSLNKKLAIEAAHIASEMDADVTFIDLKDYPIPLYDADLEAVEGMPENAKFIRSLMINSQVILIASPDYNSSLTALLKNVLDWASRSEENGSSREAYKGKIFGIMSAGSGSRGGARGLIHLRTIIEHIGGTVISQQVVVPYAHLVFDEEGNMTDPQLYAELQNLIQSAITATQTIQTF